jgi:RNA polymerase sigma-70 factor (ECF subfamily)
MLTELGGAWSGPCFTAGQAAPMETDQDPPTEEARLRALFEELVGSYSDKVFRLACAMLGNEAAAQDATQEVFLKVWKALPRYRGEASGSSWIYTITRNTCLTELQRGRSRSSQSLSEEAVQAEVDRSSLERTAEAAALTPEEVRSLLAELPDQFRAVLTLFYLEQKSYEEVACLLNLPMGTVKTHLYRAKKMLAHRLAQERMSHDRPSSHL